MQTGSLKLDEYSKNEYLLSVPLSLSPARSFDRPIAEISEWGFCFPNFIILLIDRIDRILKRQTQNKINYLRCVDLISLNTTQCNDSHEDGEWQILPQYLCYVWSASE